MNTNSLLLDIYSTKIIESNFQIQFTSIYFGNLKLSYLLNVVFTPTCSCHIVQMNVNFVFTYFIADLEATTMI